MRKKGNCKITKDRELVAVNYDPKASIDVKVDTLAECVGLLAKTIMSLEKRVNDKFDERDDVLNECMDAIISLIDDVEGIRNDIYE